MATPSMHLPSGDVLADRRYQYGRIYQAEGDLRGAADLFRQSLELAPRFAPAWFALGEVHLLLGEREQAITAFQNARECDREDRHGASLQLARLGVAEEADPMPSGYVRALFDQYASEFDRALIEGLAYRGPELLRGAIEQACGTAGRTMAFRRGLDLGCGTGLFGLAMRGHIEALAGVDLSPRMLEFARKTGAYSALIEADMLAFLGAEPADTADLIAALDALVYLPDLAPVLGEAARVLRTGGLFGCTLETGAGENPSLGAGLRFRHSETHVVGLLAKAGLEPLHVGHASTRTEAGTPVPSLIIVARAATD